MKFEVSIIMFQTILNKIFDNGFVQKLILFILFKLLQVDIGSSLLLKKMNLYCRMVCFTLVKTK